MTENNQMTLREQSSLFGSLVANYHPRTVEERGVWGARKFKRQFGGICNLKKRTEPETIKFLEDIGIAINPNYAKQLMQTLLEKAVVYGGIIEHSGGGFYERPSQARFFRLQELEGPQGKMYRLHTWNNVPDAN